MDKYYTVLSYEWDDEKNGLNIAKHGVSFESALRAFLDVQNVIITDEKHSDKEDRFFCIGKIYDEVRKEDRIVTVRFTLREDTIRIFGAGFWRGGKAIYEKENS